MVVLVEEEGGVEMERGGWEVGEAAEDEEEGEGTGAVGRSAVNIQHWANKEN